MDRRRLLQSGGIALLAGMFTARRAKAQDAQAPITVVLLTEPSGVTVVVGVYAQLTDAEAFTATPPDAGTYTTVVFPLTPAGTTEPAGAQ